MLRGSLELERLTIKNVFCRGNRFDAVAFMMKSKTIIQAALLGLIIECAITSNVASLNHTKAVGEKQNLTSSRLCAPSAIHQFPKDLFNDHDRERGGIVLHILAAVYIFACLAFLCDGYFVPALERFTERMRIKPEVAGASLLAIGNSSPELFTSLIGVYVSEDDIGVGTVVGSAVFNILFVIGSCILVSPKVLKVEVYPVLRDASFYILSLIPLAVICLDGKVDWYDALSLVLLYGCYMMIIYKSATIERLFYKLFPCTATEEDEKGGEFELRSEPVALDCHQIDEATNAKPAGNCEVTSKLFDSFTVHGVHDEETDTKIGKCKMPEGKWKRAAWLVGLPIVFLFWMTIPDSSKKQKENWFPLTFLMCILYMGSFSYVLVYLVTVIGFTFGIPDIIMGLVFIACSCNPDAIATIIIAKHGKGRMSISNCIGANIFHILLSLGLPWLTRTLITHHGKPVAIISGSIKFTILMLIGSVISMLLIFFISRWELRWPAGLTLIITYASLITVACLFEMNVFGPFNLPQC